MITENKEVNLDTKLLKKQYEILGHKDVGYTEIRHFKIVKARMDVIQFFTNDFFEFSSILEKESKCLCTGGLYVGINSRSVKKGTSKDVAILSCIVLDLDPIRDTGTSSSDESWNESINLANKISESFINSIVVSSGSGAHVYIPIEPIPADEEIESRLKAWGKTIQDKYNNDKVKIDSIFDLARVIRVFGSHNSKSNRRCEPISVIPEVINRTKFDEIVPKLETRKIEYVKTKETEKIPNGFRNQTLASLAGTMRRRGFSEGSIFSALMEENDTKCSPPLSQGEIRAIASSVSRYSPEQKVNTNIKTLDESYFQGLETRKPGIMTGFEKLDQMMAGLKPGRLYVIAARPTEGKTTFLTQIAENLSQRNTRVLYFPTEVGASSLYDKIVSKASAINLRRFQWGTFSEAERNVLNGIRAELIRSSKLFIAEDFALTIEKVQKTIEEIQPQVVIVDFLQSMQFEEGGSPKELAKAVIAFKSFAGKYQIPFIMASQLSRAAEGSTMTLSLLKGSGAIEEQGDDIIYLYTLDKMVYPRPVNIHIMKSKYGESGIVKMDFYASTCEFKEKA